MRKFFMSAVLAVALAACGRSEAPSGADNGNTQLEAPAPEAEPSRLFAASNDAANAATAALTVSTALRLPDASESSGDAQEVLTLRGANGVVVEAQIMSVVSPATQVQGQTLRALLGLPVEEPQTLVYRVISETRSQTGRGLCGGEPTSHVVVWEPSGPGEPVLKMLGLSGGAPGAAGARACAMLEYRRS